MPGGSDIFAPMRRATNTPAHQLVRLGYAAVPQLIAALDDKTLSRSVSHGMVISQQTVLTVGDCAKAILERIAGTSFPEARTSSDLSSGADRPATRKAVESWWAASQEKGEKQVLIEAITSAGPDAPAEAEILCQRYPEIAASTIIRGAEATTNSDVRFRLVYQVSKLDEPQVTDFLRHEMSTGPFLDVRVEAAYGLLAKREDEAVAAMIHEWEDLLKEKPYVDNNGHLLVPFSPTRIPSRPSRRLGGAFVNAQ